MLLPDRSVRLGDSCRQDFCHHGHYLLGPQEASIYLGGYAVMERMLVSRNRVDSNLRLLTNAEHAGHFLEDYYWGKLYRIRCLVILV